MHLTRVYVAERSVEVPIPIDIANRQRHRAATRPDRSVAVERAVSEIHQNGDFPISLGSRDEVRQCVLIEVASRDFTSLCPYSVGRFAMIVAS